MYHFRSFRPFSLVGLIAVGTLWGALPQASAAAGNADTSTVDDSAPATSGSYWNVAFLGGVLAPLGAMKTDYQQGLAAALRVGWTSSMGLGIDLALDYSPLARQQSDPLETYSIQYGTAAICPRYTLGNKVFRLWLAGGAGASLQRTGHTVRDVGTIDTSTGLIATGSAGAELHIVSDGGVIVVGSYTQQFGMLERHYAQIIGGLVFSFR